MMKRRGRPFNATRNATVQQCSGEAHSNAYIDNCGVCAPYWGRYYLCPSCSIRLNSTAICNNEDCLAYREKFIIA